MRSTDDKRVGMPAIIICASVFDSSTSLPDIGIVLGIQRDFPSSDTLAADI